MSEVRRNATRCTLHAHEKLHACNAAVIHEEEEDREREGERERGGEVTSRMLEYVVRAYTRLVFTLRSGIRNYAAYCSGVVGVSASAYVLWPRDRRKIFDEPRRGFFLFSFFFLRKVGRIGCGESLRSS